MRKLFTTIVASIMTLSVSAQGWPSDWQGVMLQGFYWDSFSDTQWTNLESQADELSEFFKLIWIPQSGNCGSGSSMGYNDLYWFNNYTSTFGNEQQLRSMINTFKSKGLGTIADVVINHRSSMAGTWMSFPEETYKGVTYTMGASDICVNDDGGKTEAQAEVKPTGQLDTGDDFDGARDLDHTSSNVQTMVKAYLDFLLNDLGYTGFRYDMVKGYSPKYTGIYNTAANPQYSVGEYWDGTTQIKNWIDGTEANGAKQSAAFDFPLKYLLRDCCNSSSNWNTLGGSCLVNDMYYRRYAVTFVDNHDTYERGNDGEITDNILAANAFILAAPGTPCIFLPHWKEYKQDIKQMIYARNMAGVNNESTFETMNRTVSQYAIKVNGTDGKSVVVLMGSTSWPASTVKEADYQLVDKGQNFAYYISRNAGSAWADVPSGSYDNSVSVTLTALSADAGAQIVYTTDGSEPTADNGTKVNSGATVNISNTITLKAALLAGGTVSGTITRHYTVTAFQPHEITVCVNADNVGWTNVNFWSWGGDGTHSPVNGSWPGDNVTTTKSVGGKTWYYQTYTMNTSDDNVCFVFSTASGSPQTVDINNVNKDSYFEISTTMEGGKYKVDNVTDKYTTAIDGIVADRNESSKAKGVYTIDGRLVRHTDSGMSDGQAVSGLSKGIYIVNGKKVVVK